MIGGRKGAELLRRGSNFVLGLDGWGDGANASNFSHGQRQEELEQGLSPQHGPRLRRGSSLLKRLNSAMDKTMQTPEDSEEHQILQALNDGNALEPKTEQTVKRRKRCMETPMAALFHLKNGVLHPEQRDVTRWSVFVSSCLAFTLLVSSARGGFLERFPGPASPGVVLLDTLISMIFAFDVVVHFFVAHVDRVRIKIEMDPLRIAKHYIKTWFWVDVLAAIPLELVCSILVRWGDVDDARILEVLQTLFFLRTLKGVRIINMQATLASEVFNFNRGVRHLIMVLILVPLVAHLSSCIWIFLDGLSGGEGWIAQFFGQDTIDAFTLYVASLYRTVSVLTTVGFGDVIAITNAEYVFSIAQALGGTVFSGITIAYINSIVVDENHSLHELRKGMTSIRAYARFRKLPRDLEQRITRHFRLVLSRRVNFNESEILQSLTVDLRSQLSQFLIHNTLEEIEVFSGIGDAALTSALLSQLKPLSVLGGDTVIMRGSLCDNIYFIVTGEVEVLSGDASAVVLSKLGAGSHFGDLSDKNKHGHAIHDVDVRALCNCDLLVLELSALQELAKRNEILQERLGKVSRRKETEIRNLASAKVMEKKGRPGISRSITRSSLLVKRSTGTALTVEADHARCRISSLSSTAGERHTASSSSSSSFYPRFVSQKAYEEAHASLRTMLQVAADQAELIRTLRKALKNQRQL